MEGAEGFIFMYFHLESLGVRVLISFIVCLIWVWSFSFLFRGLLVNFLTFPMVPKTLIVAFV